MSNDPVTELITALEAFRALWPEVQSQGKILADTLRNGGKILTAGNGGSAADAMHLAEELSGRYHDERPAMAGLSLVSDATALTCIGNDYGFERIFSRQVEALGKPGDALVVFSTSGNSTNLLQALEAGRRLGLKTFLLAGKTGGLAKGKANHELIVPCSNGARVQEIHTLILHSWLEIIESETPWA